MIVDAAVQEEALTPQTGVRGYLTTEPAARLEGRLRVRIDRLDATGDPTGASISTTATRSRVLPENIGYAERQRIGYELVRDLVDDIDGALAANLRESFGDLLRP